MVAADRRWMMLAGLLVSLAMAACEPKPDWRRVDSKQGRFSVSLPSEPRTSVQRAESVHGDHQVTFTLGMLGGVTYAVMHVDYPVEALTTTAEVLDLAVQGAAEDLGCKDATQKQVRLGEFRGRAFAGTNRSGRPVLGRVYLVGRRVYRLSVSGLNRSADPVAAARFFDSFELRLGVP
jgi:hypothetical protein